MFFADFSFLYLIVQLFLTVHQIEFYQSYFPNQNLENVLKLSRLNRHIFLDKSMIFPCCGFFRKQYLIVLEFFLKLQNHFYLFDLQRLLNHNN